jgi:hypothetical protein
MGRKPDLVLKVTNKANDQKSGRLGVAWEDPKTGWISIQLDPGTSLRWTDNIYINLYPYASEENSK